MKFLSKGLEPEPRVNLLLQLTKIGSENIKSALVEHLTKVLTENDAVDRNCFILFYRHNLIIREPTYGNVYYLFTKVEEHSDAI